MEEEVGVVFFFFLLCSGTCSAALRAWRGWVAGWVRAGLPVSGLRSAPADTGTGSGFEGIVGGKRGKRSPPLLRFSFLFPLSRAFLFSPLSLLFSLPPSARWGHAYLCSLAWRSPAMRGRGASEILWRSERPGNAAAAPPPAHTGSHSHRNPLSSSFNDVCRRPRSREQSAEAARPAAGGRPCRCAAQVGSRARRVHALRTPADYARDWAGRCVCACAGGAEVDWLADRRTQDNCGSSARGSWSSASAAWAVPRLRIWRAPGSARSG